MMRMLARTGEALSDGEGQDAALLVASIMDALEQEHQMMVRHSATPSTLHISPRVL